MKRLFLFITLLTSAGAHAGSYYFSSSEGNDGRSATEAQKPETPWKSIEKLNNSFTLFQPGDVIYFKCNDVFYGSIEIDKSGTRDAPITFKQFGTGNKPIISGLTNLSGWYSAGKNIWETSNPLIKQKPGVLLINGHAKALGRFPNSNSENKGYLNFESSDANISITDNALVGSDYNGGDIVIRKNRWVLDRNKISLHAGRLINYKTQSGYWPEKGYGYFIQNHPSTLDRDGEWYIKDFENKVGVYFSGGIAGLRNVQVSTQEVLVSAVNQGNLVFENMVFQGSNSVTLLFKAANNVRVSNCEIYNSGTNAITADNTNGLTIENSIINSTNNNAFDGIWCNNTIIKDNLIKNTGINAGMGEGDSGSYEALLLTGNDNTVTGNTIDSTGYIPITFRGNNIQVSNNVISNYAFVKDDGGAIYTWNNSNNPAVNSNRIISGNIVLNGMGAGAGTDNKSNLYAHGIYIDDNSSQVSLSNNTIANCEGIGIYVHNARELIISSNTVYNNQVQIVMQHDHIAPNSRVVNNTVKDNIFFSLKATQPVAEYKTKNDDLADFGLFDNNYYCRPFEDNAVINTLKRVNGNYQSQQVDLDGWKAMYGKDVSSKKTNRQISAFKINQLIGTSKYLNGSFNENIGGLYAWSQANNFNTTFSSNALDGGALKVSFSGLTGNNNKGTVIIGIGSVTAKKAYMLKFSLKGTDSHKMLDVYLRKSLAPYNDLTGRRLVKIGHTRTEVELVFIPTETQADASIGIDIPEQNQPVYFDNLQLTEVNVTQVNPADSVRFVYNTAAQTTKTSLSGTFADVKNNTFKGAITLQPFSSAILMGSSVVSNEFAQCSSTGSILREEWNDIGGYDLHLNSWSSTPNSSTQLSLFESPENFKDNYASRIRGYVCAPQSGSYTFWIAGDDATELYISTDENPKNKKKLAYNLSWTGSRDWHKYPSQKSDEVFLTAGKKYYIEAMHKEGGGGDNLAVAWQLPSGALQAPIPGNVLSPFLPTTVVSAKQSIDFPAPADLLIGVSTFSLSAKASSGLPVTFRIVSGPATINGNTGTISGVGTVVVEASQTGNVSFNPAPVVTQKFNVLSLLPSGQCAASGTILREKWSNVGGNNLVDNKWDVDPTSTSHLTIFEGPENSGDRYASRIRGYICAPVSGNYTFYISGDDAAELYVSTNANPSNKQRVAYLVNWTASRQWNKFKSQLSSSIYLEANQKYYVEARHKEGAGGDNLAVGWTLPNGNVEAPIPGNRLSPFINEDVKSFRAGIERSSPSNELSSALHVYPNPVAKVATINFTLTNTEMADVSIYDFHGRLIRRVFKGIVDAGMHKTVNCNMNNMASGSYIIRVSSKSQLLTEKILVVK